MPPKKLTMHFRTLRIVPSNTHSKARQHRRSFFWNDHFVGMSSYYGMFTRYIRSACAFTILRKYRVRGVIGFAGDGIRPRSLVNARARRGTAISAFVRRRCTTFALKSTPVTDLGTFPNATTMDALLLAISHRAVFERDSNDKRDDCDLRRVDFFVLPFLSASVPYRNRDEAISCHLFGVGLRRWPPYVTRIIGNVYMRSRLSSAIDHFYNTSGSSRSVL